MSEQIYVDRTTTWHAIGKSVNECSSMNQVLRLSGLDYEVTKEPVFMEDPSDPVGEGKIWIPNRFITTRDSDGHMYDIVSDKFEIVQNRDAFDFVNYMGESLSFEKAGETESGMVYVIGKLPQVDILGDAFTPHVIFRNGFSGKVKITAAICPLRLVCQNQFNFAFRNTQNAVTIRHVKNAEAKLQEAREVLKLSADYMAKLNEMATHFVGIKMSSERIERVVDYLFPMENKEQMNSFKRARLEAARDAFIKAHNAEDNQNFRGTAWGVINAYTDYMTHREPMGNSPTKAEGKFVSTTFKVAMNPVLTAIEATA